MTRLRARPRQWSPLDIGGDPIYAAPYAAPGLAGWWDANDWLDKPHGTVPAGTVLRDRSGNGRDLATVGTAVTSVPYNDAGYKNGLPGILGNGGSLQWKPGSGANPLNGMPRLYIGLVFSQYATGSDSGYIFSIPRGSGSNGIDLSWNTDILQYINEGGGLQSWTVTPTVSTFSGQPMLLEASIDFSHVSDEWVLAAGGNSRPATMNGTGMGTLLAEFNIFDFGTGHSAPVTGTLFHEGIIVAGSALRDHHGAAWRRYCQEKWDVQPIAGSGAPVLG